MYATKMTVRTLATFGAAATIAACGAVSPTPEVLGDGYDQAEPTSDESASEEPASEDPGDDFGPPWDRLPDADRPQSESHRTYRGCVLVHGTAPC